jgi:hypothetical protein
MTLFGKRKPTERELAIAATTHLMVEKAANGVPMKATPARDGSVIISRAKLCYICDRDVTRQDRYYRE